MMQHDGEALSSAIKEAGMTVQHFAKLMGVSRNTPTRWFETPEIPDNKLTKAAHVLKKEPCLLAGRLARLTYISQQFTSGQSVNALTSHDPDLTEALQKCTIEKEEWKTKAYEALEKYAKLLESHNQILSKSQKGEG